MHVWYHKKDNLILFKMISYLLWLFHQRKGSISKYGIRSQLKSCKINTMLEWSWRVHKEHVLLCGGMSFVLSWSVHQQHEDVVPGGGASTWVVHRYWSWVMSLKSMNTDEIKDHCDNKHENLCKSSPCRFILYAFVVVNVVNVLWDYMVESSF